MLGGYIHLSVLLGKKSYSKAIDFGFLYTLWGFSLPCCSNAFLCCTDSKSIDQVFFSRYSHSPSIKYFRGLFTWHRGDFRAGVSSLLFPLMALHLFTWYHHKMSCRRESPQCEPPRLLYRGENFIPVRNLTTLSCKRETTTRVGVKSVCP